MTGGFGNLTQNGGDNSVNHLFRYNPILILVACEGSTPSLAVSLS